MITEHLLSQMAALGLSPCPGRRSAQAWAEVATTQGDTFSRRDGGNAQCRFAGQIDLNWR